jgi:hypothetical protein
MKMEEEERRVHLEKRIEPNVDFVGTLQLLDSTRISNLEQHWMGAILYGVGVNTHKELDSEVLMTLAPVINEGVSCLSFRLEDEEQLVPCGYIRELLGPKKEAPEQVEVQENMLEGFWRMISGEDYKEPKISSRRDFFGGRVHKERKLY